MIVRARLTASLMTTRKTSGSIHALRISKSLSASLQLKSCMNSVQKSVLLLPN
jgi:hypothetical protein